jgi:hypothetical protein
MYDLGGRRAQYRVYGLIDANTGNLGYIGFDHSGKTPRWHAIWTHRNTLDTELARFLRSQSERPAEVVLLGTAVGLHAKVARAVSGMLADWLGTIKGTPSPGRRRPTARIESDGAIQVFPSQAACGRALGVSRWAVRNQVRTGKLLDLGQPGIPNRSDNCVWEKRPATVASGPPSRSSPKTGTSRPSLRGIATGGQASW